MIKAVIIDDEKDGRDSLKKMLERFCENVSVIATADTAESALSVIKELQPDVIFLDIEMPGESGFDMLRKIPQPSFKIIFVTAHSHYAIKAFKFSAVDYLLKPIDIDDLVESVNKVEREINLPQDLKPDDQYGLRKNIQDKIGLPVQEGIIYSALSDILRFEGDGSYTSVCMADGKKILVSRNIKEYEDMLSSRNFFRCHISHLVNLSHVRSFNRRDGYYAEMSDGKKIIIARRKKEEFIERMNKIS
jgi:two-component system LytT family response regulator